MAEDKGSVTVKQDPEPHPEPHPLKAEKLLPLDAPSKPTDALKRPAAADCGESTKATRVPHHGFELHDAPQNASLICSGVEDSTGGNRVCSELSQTNHVFVKSEGSHGRAARSRQGDWQMELFQGKWQMRSRDLGALERLRKTN